MNWLVRLIGLTALLGGAAALVTPAVSGDRGPAPAKARPAPAPAAAEADLVSLTQLEPGLWELRDDDNPQIVYASMCIGDRLLLTQPQHGNAACNREVISSDARGATVHYTCPASGFGRTSLRVETPRLVKVDSQGIHRNAPFGFKAEARRVGPCPSSANARPGAR